MRKSILRDPQGQVNRARDYPPQPVRQTPSPRITSARASYPVFLAFHDTFKLQIGWAWRGLVDAFRWDIVIGLLTRNVCCPRLYPAFHRSFDCFYYAAMPKSARMRSSLSCSMASPFFRSLSLTFSCILYHAGTGRAHMDNRSRMGSIGVSGGSIVFCGCYLSSACRSISMCVVQCSFFLSPPSLHTSGCGVDAYIFFIRCRPRGVLLLPGALLPCGMVLRSRTLG
jgi:hypothetical protein